MLTSKTLILEINGLLFIQVDICAWWWVWNSALSQTISVC